MQIQSLQDTSTYESKQQNVSGSATFGPASGGNLSASQSQVDSTYTSVTEQTGIKAGDGGFGVQVNGKTDLQGGVISSTEAAVQANQNTFTTTALATSDLQNHAAYSANATGISVGAGVSTDGSLAPGGTGVGIGHDSGHDSSVTQAGISGMAGNEAVRTGDKPTGIAKIFDAAKVEKEINAQVFITQTFSREAPRAIASYADSQVRDLQKQAGTESDPVRQAALQDDIRRWKDGGAYRVALHAAAGGMAGSVGGAVGAGTVAAAAPLLDDWQTSLTDKLQAAGASESVAKAAATVIMQTTATGIGAVASGGSVQGAAAGLSTDANNRQLHPDEKIRIKQLAGKDAIKEARLTAAACSMTKCYAEFPTDSASYQQLKQLADIGASDALIGERQLLNQQSGLFGYSTKGVFNNANIDAAKQFNNTYQIDTRAIGAVQTVAGGFGIAGSAVTAPVSCATGIGCVANAVVGTVSIDTMYAGAKQVVSGNPESTFLNQGLQGLGMSPEAAGLVEAALGLGSAVTAGAVANKVIDQAENLSSAARLSYAPIEEFSTKGLKVTQTTMNTPIAQTIIKEYVGTGLSATRATDYAANLLQTGKALPTVLYAGPDSELIKIVPKRILGSDIVGNYSPFFITRLQYETLSKLPADQIANRLGLPVEQSVRGTQLGFDVYAMKPLAGTSPIVFVSEVAPIQQGAYSATGGAQQILVPNRNLWTNPNLNKVGSIPGSR